MEKNSVILVFALLTFWGLLVRLDSLFFKPIFLAQWSNYLHQALTRGWTNSVIPELGWASIFCRDPSFATCDQLLLRLKRCLP